MFNYMKTIEASWPRDKGPCPGGPKKSKQNEKQSNTNSKKSSKRKTNLKNNNKQQQQTQQKQNQNNSKKNQQSMNKSKNKANVDSIKYIFIYFNIFQCILIYFYMICYTF